MLVRNEPLGAFMVLRAAGDVSLAHCLWRLRGGWGTWSILQLLVPHGAPFNHSLIPVFMASLFFK